MKGISQNAFLSTGLFHKAILQSGVSTCPIAIKEIGKEIKSFELASILGTDSRDPETVVEFLQTIPGDEIIEAQSKLYSQRVILFLCRYRVINEYS